jgi:NADPH:quinone reductase-like Zn-dependent oxidoreductase
MVTIMRAARLNAYGEQFSIEELAMPSPGPGQLLVKVKASSLNHVEGHLRAGHLAQMMPIELPGILGVDLAGEVVELGEGVTGFAKGDRVIGRLPIDGKGSHADYVVTDPSHLAHLPASVPFEAGATLPLVGLTGRQAVEATGAKLCDQVLVTGAVGSVGAAAVQYLESRGAEVVGAVLPSQLELARARGINAIVIDDSVKAKFDFAIDTVGGPVAALAIAATKDGGIVAGSAGFPEGAEADTRVKIVNVYSVDNAAMLQQIADAAGSGKLTLTVSKTFPLDQINQAFDLLATRPDGKIVITR